MKTEVYSEQKFFLKRIKLFTEKYLNIFYQKKLLHYETKIEKP